MVAWHPVVLHFNSMVWWHKESSQIGGQKQSPAHILQDFMQGETLTKDEIDNTYEIVRHLGNTLAKKKLNQVPSQSPKVMVPGVWVLCFRWNFPNLHFGVGGNSFISGSNRWWFKFGMASHTLNHWFHRVDVLRWKVARWRSILSTTVWRWGEFPQKNDGPKNDSSERHFRLCEGKLFMILIIRYPYNIYVYAYYIYIYFL